MQNVSRKPGIHKLLDEDTENCETFKLSIKVTSEDPGYSRRRNVRKKAEKLQPKSFQN